MFLAATLVGRGKTSGAEVEMRQYEHCRVCDDSVSYCYEYLNRDEALGGRGARGAGAGQAGVPLGDSN